MKKDNVSTNETDNNRIIPFSYFVPDDALELYPNDTLYILGSDRKTPLKAVLDGVKG